MLSTNAFKTGVPLGASTRAVAPLRVAPVLANRARTSITPKAFGGLFGGGKKDVAEGTSFYICIDCGFIYDGDFKKAPASYKCPACSSPKSRFKVFKGEVKGKVNNTGASMQKRMKDKQW